MAAVGFAAGIVLDGLIARLAREPNERGELEDDDLRLKKDGGASLEFNSETGALAMPTALTTRAGYRRVIVVLATALIFALVGRQYEGDALNIAIIAGYAAVLIVCTGTDVLAYRVPNVITYPAIIAAFAIGMLMSDANRGDVLLGGAIIGGTFMAMAIATRGGMGMGDVKLAFFVGLALGLTFGIQAMLITAIAGGGIALVLLASRIRDRRDPIPYAPFIAGGALFVLLTQGAAFVEM
jgi:leader peptidase (prepilin peptidase) / N-methyltransferase